MKKYLTQLMHFSGRIIFLAVLLSGYSIAFGKTYKYSDKSIYHYSEVVWDENDNFMSKAVVPFLAAVQAFPKFDFPMLSYVEKQVFTIIDIASKNIYDRSLETKIKELAVIIGSAPPPNLPFEIYQAFVFCRFDLVIVELEANNPQLLAKQILDEARRIKRSLHNRDIVEFDENLNQLITCAFNMSAALDVVDEIHSEVQKNEEELAVAINKFELQLNKFAEMDIDDILVRATKIKTMSLKLRLQ